MQLNEYRESRGWSYSELARLVGAAHATVVRRWCLPIGHDDRLIPNSRNMRKVIALSAGEVTPNDFYADD
tara:strand:- start:189 stop:398 length:210 start_codon:yes stop_codon:yes gene_type:complete